MGSPVNEKDRDEDEKQHYVRVSRFKLMVHEVTRGQFKYFINATGYRTDAEINSGDRKGCYVDKTGQGNFAYAADYSWRHPGFSQNDTHPVVCISWRDASKYAKWLSLKTGKKFHLPTEAQWEYAAKGGSTTSFYWGNDPQYHQLCHYANASDQTARKKYPQWSKKNCNDGRVYTSPKKHYKPNPKGLYDISGNVWEWTCSTYNSAYNGSEKHCAQGVNGERVLRGGSWFSGLWGMRSAYRFRNSVYERKFDTGFRLAQKF